MIEEVTSDIEIMILICVALSKLCKCISAYVPLYFLRSATVFGNPSSALMTADRPKSAILTLPVNTLPWNSMLSIFMSLWTIPRLWRYCTPSKICRVSFADRLSGNFRFMVVNLLRNPPASTSSSISHIHLGDSYSSCRVTTRWCLTFLSISISVLIDCRSLIGPLFSITLHANLWFKSLW